MAIIGAITWAAIFEQNYHPRIQGHNEGVTILRVGDSEGKVSEAGDVQ
ncbi:MAG: hypothetical protein ACE5LG_03655 [Anaerolineae bacterium]